MRAMARKPKVIHFHAQPWSAYANARFHAAVVGEGGPAPPVPVIAGERPQPGPGECVVYHAWSERYYDDFPDPVARWSQRYPGPGLAQWLGVRAVDSIGRLRCY